MSELVFYSNLLTDIKKRIQQAQTKAIVSANSEMISMYWDIGNMLVAKQKLEGWGTGVIPKLSNDIHNELPEIKGFSERNIGRMIAFYREYPDLQSILPQPVAKLSAHPILGNIPWGHHVLLIEKIKDKTIRFWYMEQIIANGWSRDTLASMIKLEELGYE